ncbi:MAG: response regulator [bacterium]
MARILVIDDDIQMREMLRHKLEDEGYEVLDAPDGNVGMEFLREWDADLVITDIIMPEKEGIETILELKRDFPNVKVIAICGGGRWGPEDYLRMAKGLGVHSTFSKPFKLHDLLDSIQDAL